ncbi:hypothetical protein D3C73_1672190 [compost metagenome]
MLQAVITRAIHTMVAVNGTMQLKYLLAAGKLMQAVDILRDDRLKLALALQFRQ